MNVCMFTLWREMAWRGDDYSNCMYMRIFRCWDDGGGKCKKLHNTKLKCYFVYCVCVRVAVAILLSFQRAFIHMGRHFEWIERIIYWLLYMCVRFSSLTLILCMPLNNRQISFPYICFFLLPACRSDCLSVCIQAYVCRFVLHIHQAHGYTIYIQTHACVRVFACACVHKFIEKHFC